MSKKFKIKQIEKIGRVYRFNFRRGRIKGKCIVNEFGDVLYSIKKEDRVSKELKIEIRNKCIEIAKSLFATNPQK